MLFRPYRPLRTRSGRSSILTTKLGTDSERRPESSSAKEGCSESPQPCRGCACYGPDQKYGPRRGGPFKNNPRRTQPTRSKDGDCDVGEYSLPALPKVFFSVAVCPNIDQPHKLCSCSTQQSRTDSHFGAGTETGVPLPPSAPLQLTGRNSWPHHACPV